MDVISVGDCLTGNVIKIICDQLRNQVDNALNFQACRPAWILAHFVKFHVELWEEGFANIEVDLLGLEDAQVLYIPGDPNDLKEVNC